MSLLIYGRTLRHSRGHPSKWNVRATVAGAVRMVAPAIKESCEIVLTMAGLLALVVANLALDVWIWVTRSGY
jgi:hypothetical protein